MEKLLSVAKTLEILDISRSTLYRWEEQGKIKPLRLESGHRRYKMSDLETLLKQREDKEEN